MRFYSFGATTVALLLAFAVIANGQEAENEPEVETAEPVSEDPIKLVHVLNPGEREYLSPNLIGVQNIAITFLPLSMNFINIVDAFREIVNGVKYDIVVNAVDTKDNDAEIVCHLVILEKPWLRTEWGDKVRELQHSNCSSNALDEDGDQSPRNPLVRANSINDKYDKSSVFNGGSRHELSADDMKHLEDQIVASAISSKRLSSNNLRIQENEETQSENGNIEGQATEEVLSVATTEGEQVESNDNEEDTTTEEQTTNQSADDVTTNTILPETTASTTTAAAINDDSTTDVVELSEDDKKWLDDIFSIGALNFENSLKASRGLSIDDDEDLGQQQQVEEEPIIVRSKRSANALGGSTALDFDKAEKILTKSLNKIATGEGPAYRISKIHSAEKQTVAGTLTKIDADLIGADGEEERCLVEIWTRAWLADGNEVTIKCPKKDVVKRRHSRSVEYAEKKLHKKSNHHNLNKVEHLFSKFQVKYKRHYHTTMERQMRMRIFKQNLKIIQELNANEMGSAKYGITEFADLTSTEYKQRTGLWQRDPVKSAATPKAEIPNIDLPKEFDWREKGVISPVKNQGNCGSCWAFSVTGNVEGLHAVKTGKLEEYSEQELLDCDTTDSACNGGLPDNAYEAIERIGGLELESEYPYHARKEQCHFNKAKVHVRVKGHVDLPKNETAMAQWLIANGPISIGINANAMQFYRGGVSHPWRPLCSHSNLDHGVLIVGYGVSDYPMFKKTLPYWIVKNSWGSKWGEQGYYRVYRGDNTCGVSEMASSAVLADD
ncbi:putative cysteine proteinase CG12163 isoform X1 [Musca domestica]|uniref:Cysteine proteinase CG12163 isoform X1 n=1 Tax=Musca domestica TaxID=7370 RepID=A0A9J7CTQ7_MUSDO|nr:putative cysteine proteinase CG12163 isoform X1 [Musca domestica]